MSALGSASANRMGDGVRPTRRSVVETRAALGSSVSAPPPTSVEEHARAQSRSRRRRVLPPTLATTAVTVPLETTVGRFTVTDALHAPVGPRGAHPLTRSRRARTSCPGSATSCARGRRPRRQLRSSLQQNLRALELGSLHRWGFESPRLPFHPLAHLGVLPHPHSAALAAAPLPSEATRAAWLAVARRAPGQSRRKLLLHGRRTSAEATRVVAATAATGAPSATASSWRLGSGPARPTARETTPPAEGLRWGVHLPRAVRDTASFLVGTSPGAYYPTHNARGDSFTAAARATARSHMCISRITVSNVSRVESTVAHEPSS